MGHRTGPQIVRTIGGRCPGMRLHRAYHSLRMVPCSCVLAGYSAEPQNRGTPMRTRTTHADFCGPGSRGRLAYLGVRAAVAGPQPQIWTWLSALWLVRRGAPGGAEFTSALVRVLGGAEFTSALVRVLGGAEFTSALVRVLGGAEVRPALVRVEGRIRTCAPASGGYRADTF